MFKVITVIILLITNICYGAQSVKSQGDKLSLEQEIDKLVNQLVVQEDEAKGPQINEYRSKIGEEASLKLRKTGIEAFPFLSNYLADQRHAVTLRAVLYGTVGGACFDIITSQLYSFPEKYQCSRVRTGADGRNHPRPYFGKVSLFDKKNLGSWLQKREKKSLVELQIEVLRHVIDKEKEIGFRDKDDAKTVLTPLIKHYRQLLRSVPQ